VQGRDQHPLALRARHILAGEVVAAWAQPFVVGEAGHESGTEQYPEARRRQLRASWEWTLKSRHSPALDICRIVRPDLLVLDLGLPRLNGIELLRKLRNDRKIGSTPVVVVTGDAREETAQEAYYEGANDLVTKPVDADDLIARVHEAVGLTAT
jgi:CheY-like chemotaxis protein